MADNYVFSAEPRPVQVIERTKPRYRDVPSNLMFDKRVVRGPTHRTKADLTATITSLNPQPKLSKSSTLSHSRPKPLPPSSPAPVLPLLPTSTSQVQTDDYLEELTDEVFEVDTTTQTDPSVLPLPSSAPPSSLYAAKARGVDASTCIEGQELFDYETAVVPILATLAARALDQALLEVREEEELHQLLSQRLRYERERDLTQAEVQRLQAEYERKVKEKEKRFAAERERLIAAQHAAQLRAATETAERVREAERLAEVERAKAARGDPLQEEVAGQFVPWLMAEVRRKVEEEVSARQGVDALINAGLQGLREGVRQAEEARREAARKAAEEERQRREREAEEERQRVAEAEAKKAAEAAEVARLAAEAEAEEAKGAGEEEEEES